MHSSAYPCRGQSSAPCHPPMPMRRYAHPICCTCPPAAAIPEEGLQWIYATLYTQSVMLEEIRNLLLSGNNL